MNNAPKFNVALVQTNSSDNMDKNIKTASALVREAAGMGADIVMAPENVSMMTWGKENIISNAKPEENHPAIAAFAELAHSLGIWLHGGTFAIKTGAIKTGAIDTGNGLVNRAIVFSPDGKIAARYDKIHMFDVDLGNGEKYLESETFTPGEKAVSADLPWGQMGLTTCYDLRFPHLYRTLAQSGADFIAVPAAFTRTTGRAHWHTLLRSRAIENGCYIFAPAQTGNHMTGDHVGGRQTFGHSLIIDPWGEILADGGSEPGVIMAEIDPNKVLEVRAKIPSLMNEQPFDGS
ncbi:MAG: carbon-nitrogen hydrolase family protein [Rhodospirillaceae bacterium]|nr:carbon-nitrogen hydrolase family protein [Rhodospirillaceae bacterium]